MSVKCKKCGKSPALHGVYLKRTSEKGENFEGVCHPSCDADLPQETLIIMAITDDEQAIADAEGVDG